MPSRLLKATINKSRKLNSVSAGAEAIWYRLLTIVDDYGRYNAEPALVATGTYPLRCNMNPAKVEAMLNELSAAGLIVIYTVNGDKYLYMTGWDAGKIRAKKSKFPDPESTCAQMQTSENNCAQMCPDIGYRISDNGYRITDAGESTGKPATPTLSKTTYGKDFHLVMLATDEYDKLAQYGTGMRDSYIDRLDAYLAQTGKKYKSHYATLLNWIRRDNDKPGQGRSAAPPAEESPYVKGWAKRERTDKSSD